MAWYYRQWRPYVSVAQRRAKATRQMNKLRKKGHDIQPIEIEGQKIAHTFWGQAWCKHLEKFSDYENRLPRGRSYVRNGSVCHLDIGRGVVKAMVSGSEIYNVKIEIKQLVKKNWNQVKRRCAGQIGSLLELLQGRLSKKVMEVVTDRKEGLFPLPRHIKLKCDCPDWATMCKHVAAVMYGVGARLDEKPELLFLLRDVDHEELISADVEAATAATVGKAGKRKRLAAGDVADVFGIEMSRETSKKNPAQKKAPRPRTPKTPRPLTGNAVKKLREKFKMSKSRFARLLGVSPATITKWEKTKGRLNLHHRNLKAWSAVVGLSMHQVRKKEG